jgi:hypothetical protein
MTRNMTDAPRHTANVNQSIDYTQYLLYMGHCTSRPARVTNLTMITCTGELSPDLLFFATVLALAGAAGLTACDCAAPDTTAGAPPSTAIVEVVV